MNEEIRKSRESLRRIYKEYKEELYQVVEKIDNMLKVLERENEKKK